MPMSTPVWIWGLPLVPWTMEQTLDAVDARIAAQRPSFFITANLWYAMLSQEQADLPALNNRAAFILADGMPLVWASRWKTTRLPERIAGSDLIFRLAERASERGHRLFLLGGAPEVGQVVAQRLTERYPGLTIVGIESPYLARMSDAEMTVLLTRIREAQPDVLLVAFGQPQGERWLDAHLDALGVPVCVQLGASFDFVAGRVRRAPRWMQVSGLEWLFRALQEPRRLGPRYLRSFAFLTRMLARDLGGWLRGRREGLPSAPASNLR